MPRNETFESVEWNVQTKGTEMNQSGIWSGASIRTKILVPFVLIFAFTILAGTSYFIYVVSGMTAYNMERELHSLSLIVSEDISRQEQRIIFHAQSMAETKKLADETLNTSQVRLLQIHELQALRSEKIRFFGVYGKDLSRDDPLYALVQKGLRGLRVTALIQASGPEGISLLLAGVAPVPEDGGARDVILLGTTLNNDFLQVLRTRTGAEIILFNHEGKAVAGTPGSLAAISKEFKGEWMQSLFSTGAGSKPGIFKSVKVSGTPYKAVIAPLLVNYQRAGAVALMVPTGKFMEARRLLILQAMIYALSIIAAMSLLYLFIVRGITTPLKSLERASKRMMQGEPAEEVIIPSADEIGTLALTFNQMSESLQNRERELRITAEEARNKTEELNSILAHMTEGVVVQNRDYVIEYMNKAAIRRFGDHIGKKCYNVFYARTEPCHPCSIEEIIFKKKPLYHYSMQDHEGRYFEIIAQPLHELNGETKVITLRRDVTERIRLFEQEKEMQQKIQKERLAAIQQVVVSIKHGINNSLTAIFGAMAFLKGINPDLSGDAMETVLLLESEVKRIQDIVSKLSRITDPVVTEYTEDISMIDLDKSGE